MAASALSLLLLAVVALDSCTGSLMPLSNVALEKKFSGLNKMTNNDAQRLKRSAGEKNHERRKTQLEAEAAECQSGKRSASDCCTHYNIMSICKVEPFDPSLQGLYDVAYYADMFDCYCRELFEEEACIREQYEACYVAGATSQDAADLLFSAANFICNNDSAAADFEETKECWHQWQTYDLGDLCHHNFEEDVYFLSLFSDPSYYQCLLMDKLQCCVEEVTYFSCDETAANLIFGLYDAYFQPRRTAQGCGTFGL